MLNIGIVGWKAQWLLGLSLGGAFFRWVSEQQLSMHCKQRTYEHEHEKEGILILPTPSVFFSFFFKTLWHSTICFKKKACCRGCEYFVTFPQSVDTPKMAKGGLIGFLSRRSSDVHICKHLEQLVKIIHMSYPMTVCLKIGVTAMAMNYLLF